MAVSLMRSGLTAENNIFSQKPNVKVPRSKFDLSRLNCFTSDIGMIVPVDLIQTLPGDDFDLSCQYQIDFRPLIVPTLTPYKVKIHYYYCPMSYLWEGFESFISKGRSGNLALSIPTLNLSDASSAGSNSFCGPHTDGFGIDAIEEYVDANSSFWSWPLGPMTLYDFLVGDVIYDLNTTKGNYHYLPFIPNLGFSYTDDLLKTGNSSLSNINALPFLMYQKIYRSNYMDPNLYSNGIVKSDVWFPDDIDSSNWRFNYSASNVSGYCNNYFFPIGVTPSSNINNFVPIAQNIVDSSDPSSTTYDSVVGLMSLRYAMYNDDMFNTALPFLQRGTVTSMDADITDLSATAVTSLDNISTVQDFLLVATDNTGLAVSSYSNLADGTGLSWRGVSSGYQRSLRLGNGQSLVTASGSPSASTSVTMGGNARVSFTAQQLRSLLALSVWQERNALTNGSYGQFIKVHYGKDPNNRWMEPIYIGGCTSVFNVSSVVQTSASTDSGTPQGTQVGIGSSKKQSSLGHFHASDYGYIMALMMIIPDNVYTQGIDHIWFDTAPDDFYMPEYENLSYQPIYNKQLFVSGDSETDNDLFGYSNRYVYMKQRDSVAHGRFALPASVDSYYHSYVQSRYFTSTPQLSQQFVTVYPPNIDRSFLAYPGEPAFLVQFYSGVQATRAMSYTSQPNTFGF